MHACLTHVGTYGKPHDILIWKYLHELSYVTTTLIIGTEMLPQMGRTLPGCGHNLIHRCMYAWLCKCVGRTTSYYTHKRYGQCAHTRQSHQKYYYFLLTITEINLVSTNTIIRQNCSVYLNKLLASPQEPGQVLL